MSTPRAPYRWAVAAVVASMMTLPQGPVRRRYRQELVSELWGMSTGEQLAHALSTLRSAGELHRALVEAGELEFRHAPLWCRLHLHHTWHRQVTEDGGRYFRCLACGTDDDEGFRRSTAGSMIPAHGVVPF